MSERKYDRIQDEDRGPLSELDYDSDKDSVTNNTTLETGLGVRDESGYHATPPVSRAGTLNVDTGAVLPGRAERARRPSDSSKKVVAWRDLPKKKQLVVITLARLSEPLVQTSLQVINSPTRCCAPTLTKKTVPYNCLQSADAI